MNDPNDELFRAEKFPAHGELRLESVNASLADAEAALDEKRRAFAEAAQHRAELEAKLDEAHTAYVAGRESREQVESLAEGYRAAEQFAASVRSEADRGGEHDRAQHERMVEERAAYEASIFLARGSQQREREERLEAERLDFERKLAVELGRQASLGDEYENAEAVAATLRAQIAATRAAIRKPQPQPHPASAPEPASVPELAAAPEPAAEVPFTEDDEDRKRRDVAARIAQLSANEHAAAQERAEAERFLASLDGTPAPAPVAAQPVQPSQPSTPAPSRSKISKKRPATSQPSTPPPPPAPPPQPPPEPSVPAQPVAATDAKVVDAAVVAIVDTIFGLFARRPPKK